MYINITLYFLSVTRISLYYRSLACYKILLSLPLSLSLSPSLLLVSISLYFVVTRIPYSEYNLKQSDLYLLDLSQNGAGRVIDEKRK
jgi:hypothetical protein